MKIPRDVSGDELVILIKKFGYEITKQNGSHIRLKTREHGEHNITIPKHKSIRIWTLNNILNDIAKHIKISKDEIVHKWWDEH